MASVTPETLAAGLLLVKQPGCVEGLENISPDRRRELLNLAVRRIAEAEAAGFEITSPGP